MKHLTQKQNRTLTFHLILIVLIKISVLYGLWYVFIKPNKVHVNANDIEYLYRNNNQLSPTSVPTHSLDKHYSDGILTNQSENKHD